VLASVDGDLLEELLGILDDRSRYAVESRYGLFDGEKHSFRVNPVLKFASNITITES